MKMLRFLAMAGVSLLLLAVAMPLAAQNVQINGAGATFPYPIYSKWFSEYGKVHPEVEVNYQSIGSGGGIRQLSNQTVFFGATDGPMTAEQMQNAAGKIVHLPTVLGGVVPVYNIPDVTAELKFTGKVLADIILGRVAKWNDPAITALNPGVKLPATDITVAHRSDGSVIARREDDGTVTLAANRLLASWGRDSRAMQLVLTAGAPASSDTHHAPLTYDVAAQTLTCTECGRVFEIRDGIPVLLLDEARAPDAPEGD